MSAPGEHPFPRMSRSPSAHAARHVDSGHRAVMGAGPAASVRTHRPPRRTLGINDNGCRPVLSASSRSVLLRTQSRCGTETLPPSLRLGGKPVDNEHLSALVGYSTSEAPRSFELPDDKSVMGKCGGRTRKWLTNGEDRAPRNRTAHSSGPLRFPDKYEDMRRNDYRAEISLLSGPARSRQVGQG